MSLKQHLLKYCLVAKIFGKNVSPKRIVKKCNYLWASLHGTVNMVQMANGWFALEFVHIQDLEYVLSNRPWFVRGRIFHIRRWAPSFDRKEAEIETLTLWVRLTNLPLHFWSEDAILPVVNVLGRFIKLDDRTKNTENYIFSRACMEIDLRTPLKRVLVVQEEEEGDLEVDLVSNPSKIYVSYVGVFEVCFECGSHKHKIWECPKKKKEKHFVMVDRAESDNEIEPEEMDVDPEIKQLAPREVIIYFPLPAKNVSLEHEEPINEDLNPPSPGWTQVQRKNKTTSKAAESSGIQGVNPSASRVKAPKKKRTSMVKPGISFKDVTARNGAIMISNTEVQQGLKLTKSKRSSSNKEEVFENVIAGKDADEADRDTVMMEAGLQANTRTSISLLNKTRKYVFDESFVVPSIGQSGGLNLLWNSRAVHVHVQVISSHSRFIHCRLVDLKTDNSCIITFTYAYPKMNQQHDFWNDLAKLNPANNDSWVLMGDFNITVSPEEKLGGSGGVTRYMLDLCDFLNNNGLYSLTASGLPFTWSNKHAIIFERLDRAIGQFAAKAKAWNKTEYGCLFKQMEELNKESAETQEQLRAHPDSVSDEEIQEAINSIGALKAPGPNGIHASFYQNCWNEVKDTVIPMIKACFRDGKLIRNINHTNNALIPKSENPTKVNDFRPISLCNVSYKIITKIMIKRLRPLLTKCILKNQGAFAPGRSIHDNVLIAHEIFSDFNRRSGRNGAMAVKLDLEKAYDLLDWWTPPPPQWVKINFDGSVRSGAATGGFIIRTNSGNPTLVAALNCGRANVLVTEAMALRNSLILV
ncbi:hypothetical protein ACLB2K_019715 [Fragaria x ananassa]